MITLDTSAIFSLFDRAHPGNAAAEKALRADRGPFIIPVGIMAELGYLIPRRFGAESFDVLLNDISEGAYVLDCGEGDIERIRTLVVRYSDLPLGYADACVVACAERNGGHVLAFDKDFQIVAGEGVITVLP